MFCTKLYSTVTALSKSVSLRQFTMFKTALPKGVRNGDKKGLSRNPRKHLSHQKGKTHSSTLWLDRQQHDPYYIMVFSFESIFHRLKKRDIGLELSSS